MGLTDTSLSLNQVSCPCTWRPEPDITWFNPQSEASPADAYSPFVENRPQTCDATPALWKPELAPNEQCVDTRIKPINLNVPLPSPEVPASANIELSDLMQMSSSDLGLVGEELYTYYEQLQTRNNIEQYFTGEIKDLVENVAEGKIYSVNEARSIFPRSFFDPLQELMESTGGELSSMAVYWVRGSSGLPEIHVFDLADTSDVPFLFEGNGTENSVFIPDYNVLSDKKKDSCQKKGFGLGGEEMLGIGGGMFALGSMSSKSTEPKFKMPMGAASVIISLGGTAALYFIVHEKLVEANVPEHLQAPLGFGITVSAMGVADSAVAALGLGRLFPEGLGGMAHGFGGFIAGSVLIAGILDKLLGYKFGTDENMYGTLAGSLAGFYGASAGFSLLENSVSPTAEFAANYTRLVPFMARNPILARAVSATATALNVSRGVGLEVTYIFVGKGLVDAGKTAGAIYLAKSTSGAAGVGGAFLSGANAVLLGNTVGSWAFDALINSDKTGGALASLAWENVKQNTLGWFGAATIGTISSWALPLVAGDEFESYMTFTYEKWARDLNSYVENFELNFLDMIVEHTTLNTDGSLNVEMKGAAHDVMKIYGEWTEGLSEEEKQGITGTVKLMDIYLRSDQSFRLDSGVRKFRKIIDTEGTMVAYPNQFLFEMLERAKSDTVLKERIQRRVRDVEAELQKGMVDVGLGKIVGGKFMVAKITTREMNPAQLEFMFGKEYLRTKVIDKDSDFNKLNGKVKAIKLLLE